MSYDFNDYLNYKNKTQLEILSLDSKKLYTEESATIKEMIFKKLNDNYQLLDILSKPSICFVGESNAGKSTMINKLLGLDTPLLPSKFVPTTSVAVKVAHIEEKPEFLSEEDTVLFKTPKNQPLIQTNLLFNQKYFEKFAMVKGDSTLIKEYGTRQGEHFKEIHEDKDNNFTIVIYKDSEILKYCELWDIPGTGASNVENLSDDISAKVSSSNADIYVYLSQSTKFLQASEQSELASIINNSKKIEQESDRFDKHENIFIVATHALNIIEDDGVEAIHEVFEDRLNAFEETLPQEYFLKLNPSNKKSLSYDIDDIKKRTFYYDKKDLTSQNILQKALKDLLFKYLTHNIDLYKTEYVSKSTSYNSILNKHINDFDVNQENIQHLKELRDARKSEENEVVNKNKEMLILIKKAAIECKNNTKNEIEQLFNAYLSTSNLNSLMEKKSVQDKKSSKQQFITWLQNDLNSKVDSIITANSKKFSKVINDKLEEYAREEEKLNVNTFDFTSKFLGSLSSLATIGAFSFYFSTLGNLGGYIFLSQVVGGLSALGISVGGTAAAASAVSIIGGPFTLVVGAAIALGAVVSSVFGKINWKEKFVKQIQKSFSNKHAISKGGEKLSYKEHLIRDSNKYWIKTHDSITLEGLNKSYYDDLKIIEEKLSTVQQSTASEQTINELKKLFYKE